MPKPYELSPGELQHSIDSLVESVVGSIHTDFLVLPKGNKFAEFTDFEAAYKVLFAETRGFVEFTEETVWEAVLKDSRCFAVLRAILGLSPPEWADITFDEREIKIEQDDAREFISNSRSNNEYIGKAHREGKNDLVVQVKAMVSVAVSYISCGAPTTDSDLIHRKDLVDISKGLTSLVQAASQGIAYESLLYERHLGRPFATHRDSVSGIVGNAMENSVEGILKHSNIPYVRDKSRMKMPGFEQKPDFLVPSIGQAEIIIEAKIAQDDGTARDKVARIRRLANSYGALRSDGKPKLELIACVDGRGFGIRANDITQLINMTEGKLFTMSDLDKLIAHTKLREFVGKQAPLLDINEA